jgi:hypothetical protein
VVETADFRFDVCSNAAPGLRAWVDDLASSRPHPRTGESSVVPEATVTGSDWENVGSVAPPYSTPCEIEGADRARDGLAALTFRLSVVFGSLWSQKRAPWI